MITSPVNEPLTVEVAAFVGVGVGVADCVAVELFVVEEEFDDEVDEELLVVVVDFLVVVVAFLVATAFAVGVADADAVVTAAALVAAAGIEVSAEAPAIVERLLLPNCGGVIDKTAPRPPTVPPAINNARFMPFLVSSYCF